MAEALRVATIQPPIPKGQSGGAVSHEEMIEAGLSCLEKAGREKADIACLPEVFNVFGLDCDEALEKASQEDRLLKRIAALCERYRMYTVYTALEKGNGGFHIATSVIDRRGSVSGRYSKTHVTLPEKENLKVVPGDDICVIDTDFGKIGVMTCYDAYFPELARILALKGARIIFYPALQRYFSDGAFEIQAKARALDNSVFIVRSSYGVDAKTAWKPGIMIGRSCIIDRSGVIVADLGHHSGMLFADIDIDAPLLGEGPGGTGPVDYKKTLEDARRPELYAPISKPHEKS